MNAQDTTVLIKQHLYSGSSRHAGNPAKKLENDRFSYRRFHRDRWRDILGFALSHYFYVRERTAK